LLPLLRAGLLDTRHLVDLGSARIGSSVELDSDGTLVIGAAAKMADVATHALIRERYPMLAQALLAGASAQVRNMASVGGNLMQRTRCGYFRDPVFACNKRNPGSGCPALEGNNRRHAIFGASEQCVAVHASDLAVALTAFDAELRLIGPAGERRIPIREFYLDPGETPWLETVLRPRELIVAITLSASIAGSAAAYLKVRDRASFEFALVSAAVVMRADECAIALGGVAPRPWRTDLEHLNECLSAARVLKENAFKLNLARSAVERAILAAKGQ
jgi:xanthine dehydrogenase YagS FAD-binding subunit